MLTVGDIIQEVLVRLGTSTTIASTRYTDTIMNNWLDQAHRIAASKYKWPFTEGRVSTTYASLVTDEDSLLAGEYPEGWKADSIRMLTVGGKRFQKLNYYKYRSYLEDYPQSNDRIFTDYGTRYYINENAGVSGTVSVWGQYTPTIDATDRTAQTAFSSTAQEGNEAIVELMTSYAYTRGGKEKLALGSMQKAQLILDGIWKRIQDEQFAYHTADGDGLFKRFDVLGGGLREDVYHKDRWY